MLPDDEDGEGEEHREEQGRPTSAAISGALSAAAIPATDEIRRIRSNPSQITA